MRARSFVVLASVLTAGAAGAAQVASETVTWAAKRDGDACKSLPLSFSEPGTLSIRLQMNPYQERTFPTYYEDVIQGTADLPYFARPLETTVNGGPAPSTSLRGKPVDRVTRWQVNRPKWGVPLSICPPVDCNPGGCHQFASTATVTVDFTAAAQPAAAPVAAAAGWTGEWTSNFGVMSVREDAGRLFGTYTHDSGQFEGKLEAGKLVGTWKEAPSAKDPAGSKDDGSFELTLAKDGQSFSGTFRYTASAKVDGKWSGKRKK